MKYEECKRQLTNCGYELLGSSSEGITMKAKEYFAE